MHIFITNVSFNVLEKEFLESVNIWQRYGQEFYVFFETHGVHFYNNISCFINLVL